MNTSISAAWLLKGYFDLSTQDRNVRTTQEIRRHLCEALRLSEMEMASYPVGVGWRHVFWWRETKADFAEAQFVAAISKEYPMLSLGVSVEKGRASATKKRPAPVSGVSAGLLLIRRFSGLPKFSETRATSVVSTSCRRLNRLCQSQVESTGWKTNGFSFLDGRWFERHVGEVRGDKVEAIADRIRELNGRKDTWVVLTFTHDLSPREADDMSPAAVADVLMKFNPLRERLRGR